MNLLSPANIQERAARIRLLILDVDGVMTDGRIILDNTGNEFKCFHVRDGHGIKMLVRAGFRVAIITGRQSWVVARRARELGITDIRQKSFNKLKDYEELKAKYEISDDEVAYVGDDIVDLPVMVRVGLSIAVADADDEVKTRAHWITNKRAGRGAVREVTDTILKASGRWDEIIKKYTQV